MYVDVDTHLGICYLWLLLLHGCWFMRLALKSHRCLALELPHFLSQGLERALANLASSTEVDQLTMPLKGHTVG